jgi:outer membrane protein TolC
VDAFLRHVRDPTVAIAEARATRAKKTRSEAEPFDHFIERLSFLERKNKLKLSLEDAVRRSLVHNYAIRVSSYNPAIDATRVVEAEAAFDTTFFSNITNNKVDRPAVNALSGTKLQTFEASAGIRKLLPTGMQVSASHTTVRQSNNFQFQTLNPIWTDAFAVEFRQPLLRGFGLDYNRSQIRIQKLNRRISTQQYRQQIRDTLRDTEVAYWRLLQARRNLVIAARLLANFETIYKQLYERRDFDVYTIQLNDTLARLESSKAAFVERFKEVRNAEDALVNLMNDPTVNLSEDTEIIPIDLPTYQPIRLDRVAEVQTAIDNREEVQQARLSIDSAKIIVGAAKNEAMPQLDLTFRYTVDGQGDSQSDSFDVVSKHDFTEYLVGLQFEIPVGNRARRAGVQRAKLQYAQSIARLKQVFEGVIFDVNTAIREIRAKYLQLGPTLQSAEATAAQVDAIIQRAEKKDFLTLNNELNTRQALAQSQFDLLRSLIDYGIAIIDLERAKGTVLQYNNIDLVFDDSDDPAN